MKQSLAPILQALWQAGFGCKKATGLRRPEGTSGRLYIQVDIVSIPACWHLQRDLCSAKQSQFAPAATCLPCPLLFQADINGPALSGARLAQAAECTEQQAI